jgi:hypothetical protein
VAEKLDWKWLSIYCHRYKDKGNISTSDTLLICILQIYFVNKNLTLTRIFDKSLIINTELLVRSIKCRSLLTCSMEQSLSWEADQSSQLTKKFPAFYGTRSFFTVLTSARHPSLSWANFLQSPRSPPTSWTSILILSSHLRLVSLWFTNSLTLLLLLTVRNIKA